MRQLFTFLISAFISAWIVTAAGVASAECTGTDQIAALPEEERQALQAKVSKMPNHDGLLWRATKGGLTLTLFGTYHLPHRETEAHLTALQPLIEHADQVLLEMSPADMKRLQSDLTKDPSLMFITTGPTLPDLLGETDWQRYAAEMETRQFPTVLASRFKPSWAAMMLGMSPCEIASGALTGDGIDTKIGEFAVAHHIPAHSLEDYRTALQLLDDMSLEEQLDMIRMYLDWPGDPNDLAYTLREAYLAQHTGVIWAYSELMAEQDGTSEQLAAFEKRLLSRRNQNWVDLITTESGDQDIFMAVGALHLPGQNGVLNLLEEHGFKLEPLSFETNDH